MIPFLFHAQQISEKINSTIITSNSSISQAGFSFDLSQDMVWIIAFIVAVFSIASFLFTRKRRTEDTVEEVTTTKETEDQYVAQKEKEIRHTALGRYLDLLESKLNTIRVLGSYEIDSIKVDLRKTFVSLRISMQAHRMEAMGDPSKIHDKRQALEDDRYDKSPDEVLGIANKEKKLLLILGDPGAGKTTIVKYFSMSCRFREFEKFGYKKVDDPIPLYLPLRMFNSVDLINSTSLPSLLSKWTQCETTEGDGISEKDFIGWLKNKKTLLLFDGLDEISDVEKRKKVCQWIDKKFEAAQNSLFVVTSRSSGYGKEEKVLLESPLIQAKLNDFTKEQQKAFLYNWYTQVFIHEKNENNVPASQWKKQQQQEAHKKANKVFDHITDDENKSIRELSGNPLLLQIMAILWKNHEFIGKNRLELYKAALQYLLELRDDRRDIKPPINSEQSMHILGPVALSMQEEKQDVIENDSLYKKITPFLSDIEGRVKPKAYCEYLHKRAGVLRDTGKECYEFRHKTFREYFTGDGLKQKIQNCNSAEDKIKVYEDIVNSFQKNWWKEPILFFISMIDGPMFDTFMDTFFKSSVSKNLNQSEQDFLQLIIWEAKQKKVDALRKHLFDGRVHVQKKRYILDCLRNAKTENAVKVLKEFVQKDGKNQQLKAKAEEILSYVAAEEKGIKNITATVNIKAQQQGALKGSGSFRNIFEHNAEYIHIPGGSYTYSVTNTETDVPDMYIAKYPVTNKLYNGFISFLSGKSIEYYDILTLEDYREELFAFASNISGFTDYLKGSALLEHELLQSEECNDKDFNADNQPVVGISWYAARAYCLWLSLLESNKNNERKERALYCLPKEIEWEWASSGGVRQYPWPKEKGTPHESLLNFDDNVGKTTEVGRYPEGNTPEGLSDMSGNVWEWMDNYHDDGRKFLALRGGSWYFSSYFCRCAARSYYLPDSRYFDIGFRCSRIKL